MVLRPISIKDSNGFTLVEIVISLAISTLIFMTLISTFLGIKSINMMSLSHLQAMQVVRGEVERLRAIGFNNLADNGGVETSYDPGDDLVWDTGDDKTGTLTVVVQDEADFDGDGTNNESLVDVDGDGTNDAFARPVRVSFDWTERVLGQQRQFTVLADTLIAQ